MQQKLIAGDTLNYATSVAQFAPGDGWVLKYRLTPRSASATPILLTATEDAGVYRVQASASTTATWSPGAYAWASWVERAGERYTVADGFITILADPSATAAGFDNRSQEERDLEAVNAAISARINGGAVLEYTIGNRSLKKEPMSGLLEIRSRLQAVVARQRRASAAAAGLGKQGRISVRFS